MTDAERLLEACLDDPADYARLLVYSDCLEDAGRDAHAGFVRLLVEGKAGWVDSQHEWRYLLPTDISVILLTACERGNDLIRPWMWYPCFTCHPFRPRRSSWTTEGPCQRAALRWLLECRHDGCWCATDAPARIVERYRAMKVGVEVTPLS